VKTVGPVPRERLVELYGAADVLIYPPLYAGFGLPPLEAMACGTPVVCSNRGSLPRSSVTPPPCAIRRTTGMARALGRLPTDRR
jgi:glycosyltransferase involved in cell wall biosynthesis